MDLGSLLGPVIFAVIAYCTVLWVALAFWMVRDARLRSTSSSMAMVAAALGLFLPFLGVLVYLVVRPPRTLDEQRALELEERAFEEEPVEATDRPCPTCGREIEKDFVVCPYCRTHFGRRCLACQRWLRLGWRVCPYCSEEVGLPGRGQTGRAASS